MTDHTNLRKLAEAAAAPDHNENANWYDSGSLLGHGLHYPKNTRFIEAANPATVIALLDKLEAAQAEIEAQNLMARQIILEHGSAVAAAGASPVQPSQAGESDAEKLLLEHSGCGHGRQMEQLTIGLHPGDKVFVRYGAYSKALHGSKK